MHRRRPARRGRTWTTFTAAGSTTLAEQIELLKLHIPQIETTNTLEDR